MPEPAADCPTCPPPGPKVRYYCLALPTDGPAMGFDYLEALHLAGVPVRANPIGPMFPAGRWPELMHLFTAPMPDARYVNVVCAPPDLSLGFAMTVGQVRPEAGPPLPGAVSSPEYIYQPKTALSGLYTVGVPNVAVTMAKPRHPSPSEIASLRAYTAVFAPSEYEAGILTGSGIHAQCVPPDKFAEALAPIIAGL